ncbi:MAG: hypothetical protein KC466_04915, partial [Myxococcales bacterium]|nr:hypothetical protein [Myxococcales bacterium]
VKGTHNSYHMEPDFAFDASHRYTQPPLEVQLERDGVRALELDIHRDPFTGEVLVFHIFLIDPKTRCDTLEKCLTTVRDWSDANPDHLPIFIWIEPKDIFLGYPGTDLGPVDTVIRDVLGDRVFTPDDLQGAYGSPRERVEAEGWPPLDEVRGRVLFILLVTDARSQAYTRDFTSLAGRAMFARAEADRYREPWSVVAKINDPTQTDAIRAALDADLLVASNTCAADQPDAACEAELAAGLENGVHMMHDDIPAPAAGRDYHLRFPGDAVARCNPATRPEGCEGIEVAAP